MRAVSIAFLFAFVSLWASGQNNQNQAMGATALDSILFNNGKVLATHVTDTTGETITIEKPNSTNHKKVEINKENIYSIRYASTGKEVILYIYDTLTGHDFTVSDARLFIQGEQDAQRGYHATPTTIGSFAVGVGAGLTGASFFVFAAPLFYSAVMAYPRIHIKHKSVSNLEYVKHDPYLYGYDNTARRKRTLKALLWGEVGAVIGFAVHFAFLQPK